MAFPDDIAELRRTKAAEQAVKDSHRQSIEAVTDSGQGVVDATSKLAKSQDIDGLIKEVKELQLATLLGGNKPSVVLTDQTDLGDKMGELADKVKEAISSIDSTETDRQQLAELKSLYIGLSQLKTAFLSGNGDLRKGIDILTKAVNSLQVAPNITVPTPKVTVQAPSVDFTPLQDTIKEYFAVDSDDGDIDLSCYRAQDIDNTDTNMQYVGFVNPDGNWYIIENDVKGNKLRYVFGKTNYTKAFAKAPMYSYRLLNEAIDALSA